MEILRSDGTLESAHEAIWIERHSGFAGYSDKRASGFKAFADLDAFGFVKPARLRHVWAAAISVAWLSLRHGAPRLEEFCARWEPSLA